MYPKRSRGEVMPFALAGMGLAVAALAVRRAMISESRAEHYKKLALQHEETSKTDALTGIGNLRALEQSYAKLVSSHESVHLHRRNNEPTPVSSLLFMDIDGFKKINDSKGHEHGNRVLVLLASVLESTTRDEDEVFRYAGDEFVVMLKRTGEEAAGIVVDHIKEAIAATNAGFSVSIGAAQIDPSLSLEANLHQADAGMYQEKPSGT